MYISRMGMEWDAIQRGQMPIRGVFKMIAIPNMEKPKRCRGCFAEYDTIFCKILGERIPDDGVRSDCQLIEIDEPNGILANDIRKAIASIDPHMIIATTYDEQIERAKAVKNWLLSIVGERRADERADHIKSTTIYEVQ